MQTGRAGRAQGSLRRGTSSRSRGPRVWRGASAPGSPRVPGRAWLCWRKSGGSVLPSRPPQTNREQLRARAFLAFLSLKAGAVPRMSRFFLRKVHGCIMPWISRGALGRSGLHAYPHPSHPSPNQGAPPPPGLLGKGCVGPGEGAGFSWGRPCHTVAIEDAGSP